MQGEHSCMAVSNLSPLPSSSIKKRRVFTRKRLVIIACVTVLLLLTATGGISLYFSNVLLQVVHGPPSYPLSVMAVDGKTITLPLTLNTKQPGTFGIDWADGQAIVGPVVS